jgi:3-isopropylmalate/(R)-2-methylmalate dehydratase large subunit
MATIVQQIVATHSLNSIFEVGQVALLRVDAVYLQDGNTPTIQSFFKKYRFSKVFNPKQIFVFFDHSVLAANAAIASRNREAEQFCEDYGLVVFPAGRGISHILCLENNLYEPFTLVIGADSHTCTGGARNCLALGMGASDIAAAMVSGEIWLEVPPTITVILVGIPPAVTEAKDVVIFILARYGQTPFLGRSIEWRGDWIAELSESQRITIANLTVELGGRCCFFPSKEFESSSSNADDNGLLEIDISGVLPMVSCPDSPAHGQPLSQLNQTLINYVYIGTCTNGSEEDIACVTNVLKGKHVARGVTAVITPSSLAVLNKMIENGSLRELLAAGVLITPPGCGACIGTQGPIPAPTDQVFSTGSRNFRGRMGSAARVWLGSPLLAAHAALLGRIPRPEDVVNC